ncbi:MAG TPA: DUF937 domain-containing protein [Roseiarcus sp.]|nr:DUF937 domain-containing protein [Roseiarcus sp.]
MNLNDIIQSAQGGAGLQNLGGAFGLTPEQTQAAVQAIIPALSHGLQRAAQNPGALGGVISEMASGAHAGSYVDPAQTGAAVDAGSGALGQIFGGPAVTSEIANQISRVSGLDPQIIGKLLPAVASMALGGLSHALQTQGHGEVLGQAAPAPGGGGLLGSLVSAVEGAIGGSSNGDLQSGLSSLINMFAPGVAVSPEHAQALNDILPK